MSFLKKIYFLILISIIPLVARTQQVEYNSHYIYNPYLLNPSLIGEGQRNIFLGYRRQWSGFVGAPEIQQITFDSVLKNHYFSQLKVLFFHREKICIKVKVLLVLEF